MATGLVLQPRAPPIDITMIRCLGSSLIDTLFEEPVAALRWSLWLTLIAGSAMLAVGLVGVAGLYSGWLLTPFVTRREGPLPTAHTEVVVSEWFRRLEGLSNAQLEAIGDRYGRRKADLLTSIAYQLALRYATDPPFDGSASFDAMVGTVLNRRPPFKDRPLVGKALACAAWAVARRPLLRRRFFCDGLRARGFIPSAG